MICGHCGKQIPKGAEFCPSCGKRIEYKFENKNKSYLKRIIGIVAGIVIITILVTVIPNIFYSKEKILEAYQEFYHDFYREYADEFENDTLKQEDCSAKIVLSKSGKPMLIIGDIISEAGDGKADVYLYAYEWGKVKEKAILYNIPIYSEEEESKIRVFNRDKKLYLSCMDSMTEQMHLYVYDEKEQEFIDVPTETEGDMKTIVWLIASSEHSRLYELGIFQQNDFEYFLKKMTKKEVKNSEALREYELSMMRKLKDFDDISFTEVIEDNEAWYTKDEKGTIALFRTNYSYISLIKEEIEESEENTYYSIQNNIWKQYINTVEEVTEKDVEKMLSKVDGEEVHKIESGAFYKCDTLEHIEIPSNIQVIGMYAFEGLKIKSVQIQNGVKEIEERGFYDCNELEALEVPDSVVAIGDNIISEYAPTIIYCNKGSAMESYAKENELYYVNGTIEKADSKQIEKIKKQIQTDIKERKWKDAYIEYFNSNEFYDSEAYDHYETLYNNEAEVKLLDINGDKRPEIFVLGDGASDGVVFYMTNDGQVEQYSWHNAYFSCIEGEGKLLLNDIGAGEQAELVFTMDSQGRLKEEHVGVWAMEYSEVQDTVIITYTWDGKKVTESEYNSELNKIFNENKAKLIEESEYGEAYDTLDNLSNIIENY